MKNHFFINVLINIPLNKFFTYKADLKYINSIKIGSIVSVPFGNNDELSKGVVISKLDNFKSNYTIKKIKKVDTNNIVFTEEQIKFLKWIAEYYLLSITKVFHSIIPSQILNINNKLNIDLNKKESSIKKYNTYLIKEIPKNYLRKIKELIKESKISNHQYLIIVPSIYQSFEIYKKLKSIYNNECCIYNSKITLDEKRKNWINIINNKVKIIIGVKSAIFLPFRNLKLTIVINEHDSLHKENDKKLRYNARDCAVMLTKIYSSKTILISDTPSIETYYNVQKGKYGYLNNTKNIKKLSLKKILVINTIEKKIKNQIKGLLTNDLINKINENVINNNKCLIYTPLSKNIDLINNQLLNSNKQLNILLFNKNNLKTKNKINEIIDNINNYDIIIGNQIILNTVKVKNCKLIALIDTDKISNKTNYKSNEKYFQMLSGTVQKINNNSQNLIIQTNNSTDTLFKQSINLKNKEFYENELNERKFYKYSPYFRVIKIEIDDLKKNNLIVIGDIFYKKFINKFKSIDIVQIFNTNNKKHIIELKLPQNKYLKTNKIKIQNFILSIQREKLFKETQFTIDIDP